MTELNKIGSYYLLVLVFANIFSETLGNIIVISTVTNRTVQWFTDYELSFAAPLSTYGIEGFAVTAEPDNACKPIKSPPVLPDLENWIVLIKRRGGCLLEDKVRNAENAGFQAAIIYNVPAEFHEVKKLNKSLLKSQAPSSLHDSDIEIPAVLIDEHDGVDIATHYLYNQSFKIHIKPITNFSFNDLLLPCVVVIGFCLFVISLYMIVKCIKHRRRARRNRLSSRHLKHLQIIKFKKGVYDKYEICAICLEEYCDGEKLRILPCNHAYHTKCIDPWLTNNRRNCPVCKRKIQIEGVTPESDSESETAENPAETTPLLVSQTTSSSRNNGTTYGAGSSRENIGPITNDDEEVLTSNTSQRGITATLRRLTRLARRGNNNTSASNHDLLDNASSSSGDSTYSSYGSVSSLLPRTDASSINFEASGEEERSTVIVNVIVEIASEASANRNGLVI